MRRIGQKKPEIGNFRPLISNLQEKLFYYKFFLNRFITMTQFDVIEP